MLKQHWVNLWHLFNLLGSIGLPQTLFSCDRILWLPMPDHTKVSRSFVCTGLMPDESICIYCIPIQMYMGIIWLIRYSLFTGSKHHVFMKLPVLETPSFLHLRYKVVCLFVSVQIMGFRHLFMPIYIQQFAPQQLIGLVCLVSLAIPLCH